MLKTLQPLAWKDLGPVELISKRQEVWVRLRDTQVRLRRVVDAFGSRALWMMWWASWHGNGESLHYGELGGDGE